MVVALPKMTTVDNSKQPTLVGHLAASSSLTHLSRSDLKRKRRREREGEAREEEEGCRRCRSHNGVGSGRLSGLWAAASPPVEVTRESFFPLKNPPLKMIMIIL